jgi:hypothetical protein
LAHNLHRRSGLLDEDNAEIRPKAQADHPIGIDRQNHGQPSPATTGCIPEDLDPTGCIPEDLDPNGRMNPMPRTKKSRDVVAKRKMLSESFLIRPKQAGACGASFFEAFKR